MDEVEFQKGTEIFPSLEDVDAFWPIDAAQASLDTAARTPLALCSRTTRSIFWWYEKAACCVVHMLPQNTNISPLVSILQTPTFLRKPLLRGRSLGRLWDVSLSRAREPWQINEPPSRHVDWTTSISISTHYTSSAEMMLENDQSLISTSRIRHGFANCTHGI